MGRSSASCGYELNEVGDLTHESSPVRRRRLFYTRVSSNPRHFSIRYTSANIHTSISPLSSQTGNQMGEYITLYTYEGRKGVSFTDTANPAKMRIKRTGGRRFL